MSNPTFDNSIPELTEVIVPEAKPAAATSALSAATPAIGLRTARRLAEAPPSTIHQSSDESVQAHALSNWTDEEWRRLETEIRERIARQVLGRIDFVLEQRVRDSLADVLQLAVGSLTEEIKHGLQTTLEDVIGRAVAQEVTRLKSTKI